MALLCDRPPPSLVIIGGPPRSGTTFARDLLNAHALVAIGDEMPLESLSGLKLLLEQLDRSFFPEEWRGISPHGHALRKLRVLKAAVLAVSSDSKQDSLATRQCFGFKTPGIEAELEFLEHHFGELYPRYIVCLRHPLNVWLSMKTKMPQFFGLSVRAFKNRYSLAARTALGDGAVPAGRVWLFQPDLLERRTTAQRREAVAELLDWLGLPPDDGVDRFLREFPLVNVGKGLRSAEHGARLLRRARRVLGADRDFIELCGRVGYDLEA